MTDNQGEQAEPDQPTEQPADPFDVVLDEDFVKSATIKEPTERTRRLAARWAKEPPKPTGWRSDLPVEPDERRADPPDWARKKRVWPRNLAYAALAAAVAAMILIPRHHTAATPNANPAGTARPWAAIAAPSPSQSFAEPDDKYFAGSPALSWADDAAGITPPAAAAVGSYSAATVAAGYASMRQLLAAGNLDATVLDGGPVADFTGLLDPLSLLPAQLESWIAAPSRGHDPTDVVTRFNPAATRLLGSTVKVSGTMSAALESDGTLAVTGDYRFAYAVGPASGNGAATRAVVHRVYQILLPTPGKYRMTAGKIWLGNFQSEVSNTACADFNGFVNPQFGGGTAGSGRTVDPYASDGLLASASASPSASSSATAECDSISRI